MRHRVNRDCGLLACGCALALLATACESSEKKVHATPVAQAHAPTLSASTAKNLKPATDPKHTPVQIAQAKLPPSPSQPDPVDRLVEEAEKQYQQGQQEYAAGHLEAAKQNFDQAVNVLLQGDIDVRSDERLQRELDKISEGV